MSAKQIRWSAQEVKHSLAVVRKNAVNISDSFDMPDRYLCSVVGRRDGHVYENLWQWAQDNPMNKQSIQPFHHETIGRMMQDARKMNSKI